MLNTFLYSFFCKIFAAMSDIRGHSGLAHLPHISGVGGSISTSTLHVHEDGLHVLSIPISATLQ